MNATKTEKTIGLWLDNVSTPESPAWIVSEDTIDAKGGAETTTTVDTFAEDEYKAAQTAAIALGKKLGRRVIESEGDGGTSPQKTIWDPKKEKREIVICGNWRANGPESEWAGSGTVDANGTIECAAELGEEAYEAIEDQIADGETSGEVTVHNDEQDRDITYSWEMK